MNEQPTRKEFQQRACAGACRNGVCASCGPKSAAAAADQSQALGHGRHHEDHSPHQTDLGRCQKNQYAGETTGSDVPASGETSSSASTSSCSSSRSDTPPTLSCSSAALHSMSFWHGKEAHGSCSSSPSPSESMSAPTLSSSPSSSSLSLGSSSMGDSEATYVGLTTEQTISMKKPSALPQSLTATLTLSGTSAQGAPPSLCMFKKKSVRKAAAKKFPPASVHDYQQQDARLAFKSEGDGGAMLLTMSSDIVYQIMSFLDPPEVLIALTSPVSKAWRDFFTPQQDLWRVLCVSEPFKAPPASEDFVDDDAFCAFPSSNSAQRGTIGKHRLLYTSFVQCMLYLRRIRNDSLKGYPIISGNIPAGSIPDLNAGRSLKSFLAKARGLERRAATARVQNERMASNPIGMSDDGRSSECKNRKRQREDPTLSQKKPRYGNSMITSRLLGPSRDGQAGLVNLPRSCAIYSIVNWMVAFADVEGIQTMCISTLPVLLEDEQQRLTAQRVGLADVIVRSMVRFSESLELHTEAFHAMVLLARPLGGKEGMLFDNSADDLNQRQARNIASGRAGYGQLASNKYGDSSMNGLTTMLDSMQKFEQEEKLQARACWAMVNIALSPSQKKLLILLGGVKAITSAMSSHPSSAEVQFRALFALINLVIPCKAEESSEDDLSRDGLSGKEILDNSIDTIVSLVVTAMKNFCSSATILNRACLVLHNLSQTQEYLSTLLWTPHCYQMLEWCVTNHSTDQVLRRSGGSVLHRLQLILSTDGNMRARFVEFVRKERALPIAKPS